LQGKEKARYATRNLVLKQEAEVKFEKGRTAYKAPSDPRFSCLRQDSTTTPVINTAVMHASIAAILLSASTAFAIPSPSRRADPTCPIIFDGRVPVGTAPTFFDTYATNTIFNPDYVKNLAIKWSEILKFPTINGSRFDGTKFIPVEVTINDQSIFQTQNGFRRAGLQFLKDTSDGPGTVGVKTLHWSVKQDAARPLNLTHEYLVSILKPVQFRRWKMRC
jgi:hypothetical protein